MVVLDPDNNEINISGERRPVTVLFTDLSGYTAATNRLDNEDVYELIQQYVHHLVKEVNKYEGTVSKVTGDGLMAIFGAPTAHENDAERAVRAALDMQSIINQWSKQVRENLGVHLTMRVGIDSGLVVVGGIGPDEIKDYTAIGDAVNFAHHLEKATPPSAIYTSEAIYKKTNTFFDYEIIHNVNIKGVEQPITCYRVIGVKIQPGIEPTKYLAYAPLFGRDMELIQLNEIVNNLLNHTQGHFVLVTGEAGIGKSRLVAELITMIDKNGVCLLIGHPLTYRRLVSFWIFLDLLRNYLEITPETPEADVRKRLGEKVYRVLGEQSNERLPFLEYLLSLTPTDPTFTERLHTLDAGTLHQQIFLAMRELFLAQARLHPLILILEDLHWADEASLDLLQFMLEELYRTPFIILGITRSVQSQMLNKIIHWASKNLPRNFSHLHLEKLTDECSKNLLTSLISWRAMPEDFCVKTIERAGGIPLYLEEMLRAMIDEGLLKKEDGGWQVMPGLKTDDLGVPVTLQGLILARIDQLDDLQKRTLQIASIIGQHFDPTLLAHLMQPAEEAAIISALETLINREFILHTPENPQGAYSFRHVLISEVTYGNMLKRERNRLHGRVGEAIEVLYADHIYDQIEVLARHYSWSANLKKSLHYLILAGQKAAGRYINEQARKNLSEAQALLPIVEHTPEQAISVYTGLGDLSLLSGDYQTARENYKSAAKVLIEDDHKYFFEINSLLRKIAQTYEGQGEFDQALVQLGEAQHLLDEVGKNIDNQTPENIQFSVATLTMNRAHILNDTGWLYFRKGNLDEAIRLLMKAQDSVENTSHYEIQASIFNHLGSIYYQKDQINLARNYVRKSLVLREEAGDIASVARSYHSLGLLDWRSGDWTSASENLRHSAKLYASFGDVTGKIETGNDLGRLLADMGEFEEARQILETALADAGKIDQPFQSIKITLNLSRLFLSQDEWQNALAYCRHSMEMINKHGLSDHVAEVQICTGFVFLGMGDLNHAQTIAEQAMQALDSRKNQNIIQTTIERGRAYRLLGEVAHKKKDFKLAEELFNKSAAIFQTIENPLEQGRTTTALALLAIERGDKTSARILIHEARLIFQQLGAKHDLNKLEALRI